MYTNFTTQVHQSQYIPDVRANIRHELFYTETWISDFLLQVRFLTILRFCIFHTSANFDTSVSEKKKKHCFIYLEKNTVSENIDSAIIYCYHLTYIAVTDAGITRLM